MVKSEFKKSQPFVESSAHKWWKVGNIWSVTPLSEDPPSSSPSPSSYPPPIKKRFLARLRGKFLSSNSRKEQYSTPLLKRDCIYRASYEPPRIFGNGRSVRAPGILPTWLNSCLLSRQQATHTAFTPSGLNRHFFHECYAIDPICINIGTLERTSPT